MGCARGGAIGPFPHFFALACPYGGFSLEFPKFKRERIMGLNRLSLSFSSKLLK